MEPETDIPYPVAAVNDLANNYSAEHFRFAIQQCRDVIAQVIAEDNRVEACAGRADRRDGGDAVEDVLETCTSDRLGDKRR